jgi:bifunctional DNase/RNase
MSEETYDDETEATNDVIDEVATNEVPVEVEVEAEAEAEVEATVEVPAPYEDVPFRVMHLESVLYDLTDPSPMVHLLEAESPFRYLVIPVALPDAIAIQYAHSAIVGRRPSTHELFYSVLAGLGTEVIAARIVRYDSSVFYAELDLMTPKGRRVFDCRTSDAISMALRQKTAAPILCSEEVLQHYYS